MSDVGANYLACLMDHRPHTPFDEEVGEDARATFTYRWGKRASFVEQYRGDGTSPLAFPKVSGPIMALFGVGFVYLGIKFLPSMGPLGWLPVSIGAILILTGVAIFLQKGPGGGRASAERVIRVHYEARAVEFSNCTFYTGLVRHSTIDFYLCPVEELTGFQYDRSRRALVDSASVRIWTARGYLVIPGDPTRLSQLVAALTLIAGKRPAPALQRTWVVMLVVVLVAALVIAAAVYFKIV